MHAILACTWQITPSGLCPLAGHCLGSYAVTSAGSASVSKLPAPQTFPHVMQ